MSLRECLDNCEDSIMHSSICVQAQSDSCLKCHLIGLAKLLKALVSLFITRVLIWVKLPC